MKQPSCRHAGGAFVCAVLLALAAPRPAAAQPGPRSLFDGAAVNVANYVKGHGKAAVAVAFTGPPTFKSSAGAAFTQLLSEALAERGVRVVDRAEYGVKGEFKPVRLWPREPRGEKRVGLHVSIKIVDLYGEPVLDADLGGDLGEEQDVLRYLGASADLAGARDLAEIARRTRLAVEQGAPPDAPTPTALRSGPASRYAVELLVGGDARRLERRDGLAYVPLRLGEEYVLRLTNRSDHEAAAYVAVDGLSVFHFSELREAEGPRKGEPRYRYYIVPPRGAVDVPGWHKNEERALAFRASLPEDSAAARLGRTADIGMVTVSFFACWEKGAKPPPDETPLPLPEPVGKQVLRQVVKDREGRDFELVRTLWVSPASERVGTTFGTDLAAGTRGVQRTIGALRSAVTLRYERPRE
jgi:hypothetical protein